jgi:hypothetical protein
MPWQKQAHSETNQSYSASTSLANEGKFDVEMLVLLFAVITP